MTVLRFDRPDDPDPLALWGKPLYAADASRHVFHPDGGPRDGPWRELVVKAGDYDPDPPTYGERCELGANTQTLAVATFWRYREGDRLTTKLAIRLGEDYPIEDARFQVVMQMKQTSGCGPCHQSPVLALLAQDGEWRFNRVDLSGPGAGTGHTLWAARATLERWARFAITVTYSRDPAKARAEIRLGRRSWDLGGGFPTLATETQPGFQTPVGGSVPSHLRIGPYHHPDLGDASIGYARVSVSS